jgi:hypothetical protein
MNKVLTAKYTAAYKGITVTFFEDDSAEFTAYGDVTDAEIDAALASGGADIAGYSVAIEL